MRDCACGSGLAYAACCQPLHAGQVAASPAALMRSRYCAFVREDAAYLLASWAPATRPAEIAFPAQTQWLGLTLHHSHEQGEWGEVAFTARFREGTQWWVLDETSRFQRGADGHWRYVDGDARFVQQTPGRNDDCPCGSGRKFKKCCAG